MNLQNASIHLQTISTSAPTGNRTPIRSLENFYPTIERQAHLLIKIRHHINDLAIDVNIDRDVAIVPAIGSGYPLRLNEVKPLIKTIAMFARIIHLLNNILGHVSMYPFRP